jgi:hypothetical protein
MNCFSKPFFHFFYADAGSNATCADGGALHLAFMRVNTTISDSTFVSNSAGQGGGLYVESSDLDIHASKFVENIATECGKDDEDPPAFTNKGCGGAIYLDNPDEDAYHYALNYVTIADSEFSHNSGLWGDGGALYILQVEDASAVAVHRTNFVGNTAGTAVRTMVLELGYLWGDESHPEGDDADRMHFRDTFGTLKSGFGGAIAWWGTGVSELESCVFSDNIAAAGGGGMFWAQQAVPRVCGCGGVFQAQPEDLECAASNYTEPVCAANGIIVIMYYYYYYYCRYCYS